MKKIILIIAILISGSFYAQAQFTGGTNDGFSTGGVNTPFEIFTAPTVSTTAITSITATGVTTGGETISDGGATITEKGVCWATTENPEITDTKLVADNTTTDDFASVITTMDAGTFYYVRAYATNSEGTGYGDNVDFWTFSEEPDMHSTAFTATTTNTTNIDLAFSVASGISDCDGYIILKRTGDAVDVSGVVDGIAPGSLTLINSTSLLTTITNTGATLYEDGTVATGNDYHYALIPYNWNGTNPETYNYYTDATIPITNDFVPVLATVTTTAVTSITTSGATTGGEVTDNGGGTASPSRGICWGTSENPETGSETDISGGWGIGSFVSTLTGLTEGTTYHVRAYATNTSGTSYGDDVVFTTVSTYSEIELWRYYGGPIHYFEDAIADESNYGVFITNPSETIYDYEFTILNVGVGEAFTLTSTLISGDNADEFSLQTAPAASVAAGGSTTFTIRYTRPINSTNDVAVLTIANTETVATDGADETTFVINFSVATHFQNVDVKFEDIDLNGKPEVGFGDDVTFDGSKTFDEAGYQLASDYAMSSGVIWIKDENAEANGYIVIDWDDYTYGNHYYCRSYIKYTDGTEVYGEISAFTRNEGSGLIKIGND